MNDIEILRKCLVLCPSSVTTGRDSWFFVELKDKQAKGTNVKIKGLPHNSIVIRADTFEFRHPVFAGSKDERKRADFVIVSNREAKKWIICIEIKRGSRDTTE